MGKGSGDREGWGYSRAGGAGGIWTCMAQAESRGVNVADSVSVITGQAVRCKAIIYL